MIEKKSLSRFSFVLPLLLDPAMHIFFEGWGAGDGGREGEKWKELSNFF